MKLVSVIIPAYNAGAFIKNCLDSVLNQTYKELEIIVVNDGSTDNTLEIVENLAKNDNRIKILSKENGGVSSARNEGLKIATGDYLTFVDADDKMEENGISDMVSLMTNNVDFVVCSHNEVRLGKVPHLEIPARYKAEEINDNFIKFDRVIWWPWGKLYRRSVITENCLEYDTNISFGEDHVFNLLFTKHIKGDVVVSDKIVYNYHYIRGGLCSKYLNNYSDLEKYIYLKIADYFLPQMIPRKYEKHYIGCYFKGSIEYYIAWLPHKKAIERIEHTIDSYNSLIDDEILQEYFTPKQFELIKSNKISQFITNYILHNPRNTIIRKFRRTVRRFLESIQKLILK